MARIAAVVHGLRARAATRRRAARGPRSRADAQALVKQWCADAIASERRLADLAAERYANIDWSALADPAAQLGDAPLQARVFAARARQLK